MYPGSEVRPKRWSNVIDLYDDGEYSVIWGSYDESETKSLGVRWNGSDNNRGYPSQGKYPLWYVEPDFLVKAIILDLIKKLWPRREMVILIICN